jgi:fructose/tagatose bisphosphate aldolase
MRAWISLIRSIRNTSPVGSAVNLYAPGGVSVEGELGCLGSLETGMMGEEDGHGAEGKLDLDMFNQMLAHCAR